MKHILRLHDKPFVLIESGRKTLEARLYDEKRRSIQVGDQIQFTNRTDGRVLHMKVDKLYRYSNFRTMFEELGVYIFGGEELESTLDAMQEYYSVQQQRESGVVGISIKPVN
jgi:ASC-1-like (ASCH) protein